jgi:hypothetical protein
MNDTLCDENVLTGSPNTDTPAYLITVTSTYEYCDWLGNIRGREIFNDQIVWNSNLPTEFSGWRDAYLQALNMRNDRLELGIEGKIIWICANICKFKPLTKRRDDPRNVKFIKVGFMTHVNPIKRVDNS